MDYQRYAFMQSWDKQFVLWLMTRNGGKALALDTPIPTPNGIKKMGELNVGDSVFGADGKPTKILWTSNIFKNHECFKIIFEDGEEIIADADHLWDVKYKNTRKPSAIFTTKEMFCKGIKNKNNEFLYRVKISKPLENEEEKFEIHPYVLGVWLGDGNSRDTRVTSHIDDCEELSEHIKKCGYNISINLKYGNCKNINIGYEGKGKRNNFKEGLKKLNLLKNKHIPEIYFNGSFNQRLELLQGLMDTDGSCFKKCKNNYVCEFYQSDYNFINQVSRLLSTLGIKHRVSEKKCKCNDKSFISYRISFYTDKIKPCFKLKRKLNLLPEKLNKRSNYKSIIDIQITDSVNTKCIAVDNKDKLYLCGNKYTVTHNSTLSAPFAMTKMMLFPNFEAYILSLTSAQSQDTFLKMEKIAKQQIQSFTGLTDIFAGEVVTSANNPDGFTHSPQGFKFELYNGSKITSLSGCEDNIRGKRSSLNLYDESGFISENYAVTTNGFCLQNADFKLGKDLDMETVPKNIPNQLLYCSSASSVDSYFYGLYKEYSKKMFAGSKNHFVADFNCEVVINATNRGKKLFTPLLTQDKVDDAMNINREKALREYYNKFTLEGGSNQPIKRAAIIKNSTLRPPVLCNETNDSRRFIIAYDPARSYDNSAVAVGELIDDEKVGLKLRIQNCVNLVDIGKKRKTPMRTPEQMDYVKQMLLDYNGEGFADYENIEALMLDAGSGGGGLDKADYFMEDWVDKEGNTHRGLIDKEVSADYVSKFPNAVDKLKLMSPKKYKTEMYDAFIEMLNLDLIEFTESYDMKGFLTLPKESENQKEIDYYRRDLTFEEEIALKNIDVAKEELVQTYRFESTGSGYRYDLPQDKKNKMHDDRALKIGQV
ncbi:TPA: LAGLIDADG family homing endonuclease [Clostridium perfringens]